MKISKIIIILSFFTLAAVSLKAQEVKLITVNQLESRFMQGKDTTYVINFWATWCKPCIKELPAFEKLRNSSQGKPVKVLLISTDLKSRLESSVKPFVKTHKLSGEIYFLNEAASAYTKRINSGWSGALPATLIVKNGKQNFHEAAFTFEELASAVKGI